MKPLIVLVLLALVLFSSRIILYQLYRQKFYSLLISIRQASPELDIPEQVFTKRLMDIIFM